MNQKTKQAKTEQVVVVAKVVVARVKHHARGLARSIRRAGLVRDWRNTKGAKQMLPPAGVVVAQ